MCKEWTVPNGKFIKGFYVSIATEVDYDYFTVSLDGAQKYNKSGSFDTEYVDVSTTPGTILSACMRADEGAQDGFGGEVLGVKYE